MTQKITRPDVRQQSFENYIGAQVSLFLEGYGLHNSNCYGELRPVIIDSETGYCIHESQLDFTKIIVPFLYSVTEVYGVKVVLVECSRPYLHDEERQGKIYFVYGHYKLKADLTEDDLEYIKQDTFLPQDDTTLARIDARIKEKKNG